MIVRHLEPAELPAFIDLNLAWIERDFAMEESDRNQLYRAKEEILGKGGAIIGAEDGREIIGCGAVLPAHVQPVPGKFFAEIVKMATADGQQGKGIGRAVIERLIEEARAMGADGIWIETSDRLDAANHLYRKAGFRNLSADEFWPTPYNRCSVQMLMEF
jgi:GNAT superfamily N-acetyltransferase